MKSFNKNMNTDDNNSQEQFSRHTKMKMPQGRRYMIKSTQGER